MTDTGAIYNTAGQVIKLVTENPWEWGWDARVSIGTLALAFVTVLLILSTVGVGVYAYRQAEKHHRQSLAGILSTHGRCKLVDSYEIDEYEEGYYALKFTMPPRNIGAGPCLGNFASLHPPNGPKGRTLLFADIPNLGPDEACSYNPTFYFVVDDADVGKENPSFSNIDFKGAKLSLVSNSMFGEYGEYEYHFLNSADENDPRDNPETMNGLTYTFDAKTFDINSSMTPRTTQAAPKRKRNR